ncbi:MAG: O-antigen ligase family protein [Cryomorphaceae bacterium]|nr:O-antigen ligase family protein [Cryomorphaceae bacterium]
MKLFQSPFFYLPVVVLIAISNDLQDIGLWQRMAVAGFIAIIALGMGLKNLKSRLGVLEIMALGLVAWPLVKLGNVNAPSELYGHIARMSLLFGTMVISAEAFRNDEKGTLKAFGVGAQFALLIAGLSILPSLGEAYKEGDIYLASGKLFAHKNYAAATLLMLIPAALSVRLPDTLGTWLQRIAVGLALFEILFLRTRGVWLAAALMALVAAGAYAAQKDSTYRNQSLIALAVLVVGVGIAIVFGGAEKVFDSSTIQSRMHYWKASQEMFLDNPISGVGGGQWKIEYPATGLKGTNESVMNGTTSILRPHNDVLWLLSETGIGAFFFIGMMLLALLHLLKNKGQLLFGLTIVAFGVYGFGEFPLERTTLLIPFAVAMGYLASQSKSIYEGGKPLSMTLSTAALVFTVAVSVARVGGEKEAAQALDGYMKRNTRAMVQNSVAATGTFFEMDIYNNPMPYFEGLGILISGGQQPNAGILKKSAAAFQQALEIHPNHILSLNQLAQIHRIEGNYAEASRLYNKVLSMSPRNTSAALRLAEVERVRGDIYASMNALKKLDKKYTPQNLNGLGREATQTLQAFAAMSNPRPASQSLHRKIQGKKPGKMWQIWAESRKN